LHQKTSRPTDTPEEATLPPSELVVISASTTQVPTKLLTNEVPTTQSPSLESSIASTKSLSVNPTQVTKAHEPESTETEVSPSPTQQSIDTSMKTETMPESKGSETYRSVPCYFCPNIYFEGLSQNRKPQSQNSTK